jgi:hypothetical protein
MHTVLTVLSPDAVVKSSARRRRGAAQVPTAAGILFSTPYPTGTKLNVSVGVCTVTNSGSSVPFW